MARPGLTKHRKFVRLAKVIGSPLRARGALELLWEGCYESGDDYVGTAADIETLVGWTGEAGALTRALVECGQPEGEGFIEHVTDVTYRVHDLWHHAPDYVSNRRSRETERRIEKVCAHCGVTYHAADGRSKFCSNACKQGGWRDRNRQADSNVTDPNRHVTDRNRTCAPAPAPAPAQKKEIARASGMPGRAHSGGVLAGSLPRDHADHVFCDFSHCVPRVLHSKLSGLLAPKYRGDADAAGRVLEAWYPVLVAALPADHVMGDAFKFWLPQFDKKFASKARPDIAGPHVKSLEESKAWMADVLGVQA